MNKISSILGTGLVALVLANSAHAASHHKVAKTSSEQSQIIAVLTKQQNAWNACDIDGFMQGYWKSPDLRFASGGTITRGWQATLDGYKARYGDCTKMGTLEFSGLDVQVFSTDAAQVFGHWGLVRKSDHPHGLFTLTLRKIDGAWRVVADHTSSAANE